MLIQKTINEQNLYGDFSSNQLKKYKKFQYNDEFKDFICPNPFIYAEFTSDKEFSVCCYLDFLKADKISDNGMMPWNSLMIQELRRSILCGEFSYCDKSKCAAMQEVKCQRANNGFVYQLPYKLLRKNDINNETIKNCLLTGKVDDLPLPEIISLEDDMSCNLSCPSCRKNVLVLDKEESERKNQIQTELLDSIGHNLKELWLCGAGDPFAARSYRNLLNSYDFSKFQKLKLRIDSNGQLFNEKNWNKTLANLHDKISLVAISVDAATKETYEKVRQGGNFNTLMNNIYFIAALPERKKGLSFIIRMIVQETNFREMKEFVELGISLKVDSVVFSVLQNWGTYSNEEYLIQAVHLPKHPHHNELLEIISDKIFLKQIVDMGNLIETYHEEINK